MMRRISIFEEMNVPLRVRAKNASAFTFSLRVLLIGFLAAISAVNVYAQQASEYFPAATGYRWFYHTTMLDSVNNPVDSMSYYSIDSFAVEEDYRGIPSKLVLTKSGAPETLPLQPFLDTTAYSFDGSNSKMFFSASTITSLLQLADSLDTDSLFGDFGIIDILNRVTGWYTLYKFANPLNQEYTIVSYDTSFVYESVRIYMKFDYKSKRVADQELPTFLGPLQCKKFINSFTINYTVLPPFWIPALTVSDTTYIAPGNWIVKQVLPSSTFTLPLILDRDYTIPGRVNELVETITGINEETPLPQQFRLEQNFPNPFNPSTEIQVRLSEREAVTLSVFDVLGREVAVIFKGELPAGVHSFTFDANQNGVALSGGVYFYRLTTNSFSETKKMTLVK